MYGLSFRWMGDVAREMLDRIPRVAFAACAFLTVVVPTDVQGQQREAARSITVQVGAHAPLWESATDTLAEGRLSPAPLIGFTLHQPLFSNVFLNVGANVAIGTYAEVRLRPSLCTDQVRKFGCEGDGPFGVVPMFFGGLEGRLGPAFASLSLAAQPGLIHRGHDCPAAPGAIICSESAVFPRDHSILGVRYTMGFRWTDAWRSRDLIFEIGERIGSVTGGDRYDLTASVGVSY